MDHDIFPIAITEDDRKIILSSLAARQERLKKAIEEFPEAMASLERDRFRTELLFNRFARNTVKH
jgi:hypothetical protein